MNQLEMVALDKLITDVTALRIEIAELREEGYLSNRKGTDWNMPTQRYVEQGLFEIKESTHIDGNGVNITTKTVKVSGKGQQYFINKFLAN